MSNFRARVLCYPSARLEIKPSKVDLPVFENLDDLYRITRWRGYYGGIRIIQALIVRLVDYCREHGIELPDRNFTLEYESNMPQRLGLGGSSAIITASLRAICQYYALDIPLPIQANIALETETRELNVPAGLQDRVVQAYQGLVYMDFSRHLMDARGYGEYEQMNPACCPTYMWPTELRSAKVPKYSTVTCASAGCAATLRWWTPCGPGPVTQPRAAPACWNAELSTD